MLCHRQAMPAKSSYSANPAFHSASKKPARSHARNRLCTALALPKRSAGSAFHWQPVRSTYTMASNTWRAGLGGRPAPGLRRYFLPGGGDRCGISGSTRRQNASVTPHESTRFLANVSLQRRVRCGSERQYNYLRISSKPPPARRSEGVTSGRCAIRRDHSRRPRGRGAAEVLRRSCCVAGLGQPRRGQVVTRCRPTRHPPPGWRGGKPGRIRNPTGGHWREHFGSELRRRFAAEYGDLLERCGYPPA